MNIPTKTAVQVVIGAGSIGQAIARRTGAGKHLLLADFNETALQNAKTGLEDAGHTVTTQRVDVSDAASLRALAQAAAELGDVVQVISTAGVSPVQAPAQAVLAAALTWGDRGARVNCLSPGIILTPLARDEMSGPGAEGYRKMIEVSAAGRVGTADEVATAAAFLLGPDAGFITGTDLLIDGGVIAALRAGRWQFGV